MCMCEGVFVRVRARVRARGCERGRVCGLARVGGFVLARARARVRVRVRVRVCVGLRAHLRRRGQYPMTL